MRKMVKKTAMMMSVISGAYNNTSTSVYIARFQGNIAELLVSSMSNLEIVKKYNPPLPKELSLSNRLTPAQRRERARLRALQYVPRSQLKDAVVLNAVFGNNQVLAGTDIRIENGESMVVIGGSGTGKRKNDFR